MKQKYHITVADMQLNIVSDAPQDEVENIVGILDRRMRDINLKSPSCTKNEAAILCALSYCSERIAAQEAYKKMEKDASRYAAENERLKQEAEALKAELEAVRQDNVVMRSIIDRTAEAVQTSAPVPAAETNPVSASAEETPASADKEELATPVASNFPEEKEPKAPPKSRVGTMFDLLTFSDV